MMEVVRSRAVGERVSAGWDVMGWYVRWARERRDETLESSRGL